MITFIEELAREAGAFCRARQQSLTDADVTFKSAKDLVTKVDEEVEEFLAGAILARYPDHTIVGEEGGTRGAGGNCRWFIDPIDGTTSYLHGLPFYAVSIGYMENGCMEHGVVYGPELQQLFSASRGRGAYCNGEKIEVSGTSELINSVLATGFSCLRSGLEKNNLPNFMELLPKIRDFRRGGSAALDLAYVAAGKLDGYWEMNVNSYDVSGGILLVTEAGGRISDFHGGGSYPQEGIVASNGRLHEKLCSSLLIK